MNHDRLTYKIFEYDLQHFSNDNWCGELESILEDLNMHENLLLGEEVDLEIAKEKLKVISDLDWQDNVGFKSKLRTYAKHKLNIETENYLTLNINKYERSVFAKLRSGTLSLQIEKGRYSKKTLENRTCPVCNTNAIEDEIHFVINCDAFSAKRCSFFTYISNNVHQTFTSLDTEEKFVLLMSMEKIHLKKFIKFVIDIWESRKNKLLTM